MTLALPLLLLLSQAPITESFGQMSARVRAYPALHRAYRLIDQGRLPEARAELQRALQLQPGNAEARRALVILLFRLKDFAATVQEAERLPRDAQSQLYRAMAEEAMGERQAAEAIYEGALGLGLEGTERVLAVNSLAELRLRMDRPAEAAAAIERLSERERDLATRRRLAIAIDRSEGDSRAAWQSALQLAPRDATILRTLADVEYRRGDLRASLAWTRSANEASATAAGLAFETQLLIRLRDYDAADALIARRLEQARAEPVRRQLLLERAEIAQRRGSASEERKTLERVRALGETQEVARRLATLAVAEGRLDDAAAEYRRSLAQRRNVDDLAALAAVEFERRNWQASVEANRSVLAGLKEPLNRARVWMAIGWAEQQRQRFREAAQAFGEAVKLTPPPTARSEYATALTLAGDPAAAADVLRDLLRTGREPSRLLRLALLEGDLGRVRESRDLAREALSGLPNATDRALALRRIGDASRILGDDAAARAAFGQALEIEGPKPDLLRALLDLSLRLNDVRAALAYARQIPSLDTTTQLAVAQAQAQSGDVVSALTGLQRLLGPAPPSDSWRILSTMAELELRRERPGSAADLLLRAAQLPGSPQAQLLERAAGHLVYGRDYAAARAAFWKLAEVETDPRRRASAFEQLGDVDVALSRLADAAASYRRAIELGAAAELRLANVLAVQRQWSEAAPLYEKAYTAAPSAEAARAAGQSHAELGRWAQAVDWLTRAQQLQPTPSTALRLLVARNRLNQPLTIADLDGIDPTVLTAPERVEYLDLRAAALDRGGRLADAVAVLEQAQASQPSASRTYYLAGLYRRQGQLAKAIAAYRQVLQANVPGLDASGPLAYALIEAGDRDEAIRMLERAARNAVMEAQLGYLYRGEGRNRDALSAFDRAIPESRSRSCPERAAGVGRASHALPVESVLFLGFPRPAGAIVSRRGLWRGGPVARRGRDLLASPGNRLPQRSGLYVVCPRALDQRVPLAGDRFPKLAGWRGSAL